MRILIQRVIEARVTVSGTVVGEIAGGLLLLVGIAPTDTTEIAAALARKVANLRIFDDSAGLMNRSLLDLQTAGDHVAILAVSQFTLYADVRKGRRPSFVKAARGEHAQPIFEGFCAALRSLACHVETGVFGAEMRVGLTNDGPVTIWLDSDELGL